MKEESDSDTKLDTDGRCRSVEANSVDRYISTLHCNLDSRYQVSGLLAMEMRKPQNFAHHKGLLQSWKRSTAFGAGINLQSDKLDSSESINADELPPRCWPNPLTSKHQAAMAQRFCSYFFQRYCNQSGEIQQQGFLTQKHSVHQADGGQSDSCDEQQSIGIKLSNSRKKRTLCPVFYTGSLADAFKLSERPPGRPWPVTLLYLHHNDSVHTHRFVQDILCSHEEDTCSAPVTDCASNSQMPDSSAATSEQYELREPLITPNVAPEPEVIFPLSMSASLMTSICPAQQCEPTVQSMPVRCRQSGVGKRKQLASEKFRQASKDNGNQAANRRHERARSFYSKVSSQNTNVSGNKGVFTVVRPKSMQPTNRMCDATKNTSNAAQVFSLPDQSKIINPDQTDSTTIRVCLTTAQSDGGLEYPIDGHAEDVRIYAKVCRNKSFRSLLMERSAGLVPWDCSTSGMRKYLRSAFVSTCLAQWLDEWKRPNQYPVLVAVGRTIDRRVVCSRLYGATATRTGALRWLNEVTLAHFYDYRHVGISSCSEKSDKLSRASSVCPSISAKDAANSPKSTPQNHSRITITKSRTTAVTGELTEHNFLSNLGAFSTIGGKESTVTGSSRASTEDTQYRVAVTPQPDSGQISVLFEVSEDPPIKQNNLQLKRVHLSFKNAISSLERATAPIYLRQLNIPVPTVMDDLDAQDPTKPVPPSVLVATLCTVPRTNRIETRYPRHRDNTGVSQTNGGGNAELNEMKRKTVQQRPVQHPEFTDQDDRGLPWFFTPEALDLKSAGLSTSFYEWFKQYLLLPFPSTPPFLLGRFQTALLRSIDVLLCQQTSPLLVYLHDSEAPGVIHFVANILCSRRFTSKLFDHGLHIWPLDVTGVADHGQRRTGGQYRTQSVIKRTSSQIESRVNQDAAAPEGVGKMKTKYRFRSLGLASSRFVKQSKQPQPQTQASSLYPEKKRKPSFGDSVQRGPSARGSDEIPSPIERCAAARDLMEYFDGQPANQTLLRLFKIPVLPTLVNMMYSDHCFSITHVLLPSSTTKEAIGWLNVLLKFYNKLRLRNCNPT